MNKKIVTTVATIVLMATIAFGQKKTYVGAQVAVIFDVYELIDNGGGLRNVLYVNGLWGLNIRQDFNNRVFLETGLLRKYYNEGVAFKISDARGAGNAIEAWLIPLRLGTKINLRKEKIFLVPVIGYSFCINSDRSSHRSGSGGVRISSGDSARYYATSNYHFTKTFPLLQTGMGFEFKLLKTALFSVSANYYTGFKKIMQQDISYTVNNSSLQTATTFSKGDHYSFEFGLKYPVSNFWKK